MGEHTHHPYGFSRLPGLYQCPGSARLSEGIAEVPSYDADEGTRLHHATATGDLTGLNTEQTEAVEYARAATQDIAEWATADGTLTPSVERWLVIPGDGGDVLSAGTPDWYLVVGDTAYLIEYKFGRNHVPEPANNVQLAAQSCAIMGEHGVSAVIAYVIQPRLRRVSDPHTFRDLDGLTETVRAIIRETQGPDMRLCAGPECRYCPAPPICPALSRASLALIDRHPSAVTDPAEMARYLDAYEVAGILETRIHEWRDSVKYHAVALQAHIPGWRRVEERGDREIADISEAYARLSACTEAPLTAQQFVACCTLQIGKLEDAAARAYKAAGLGTLRDGKAAMALLLGDVIGRKAPKISMERERG